jgi:hypothetical protein
VHFKTAITNFVFGRWGFFNQFPHIMFVANRWENEKKKRVEISCRVVHLKNINGLSPKP